MDIHQLRVFSSVFRHRSFSRASEDLHLRQPTISEHIRSLEDDLGLRLFDRVGRSVIPTREAENLYVRAVEVIEKADMIRKDLRGDQDIFSGEIVIGASTIPGTYLIPRRMASFRQQYPLALIRLVIADSLEIAERVSRHEILIGIVGSKPGKGQLHYEPIMEDELVVIASPAMNTEDILSVHDLIRHPFVIRESGSGTRTEMERILNAAGISVEELIITGIFGSTDAVKEAVKANLGISIVSRLSVTDELKYGLVKELAIRDAQMKRSFYCIRHRLRSIPAMYERFVQVILS